MGKHNGRQQVTPQDFRPVYVTWQELIFALAPLHRWDRAWLDRLHDVWKCGPPSPDSRILVPGYDERRWQPGNVERRLVLPGKLAAWLAEMSERRG